MRTEHFVFFNQYYPPDLAPTGMMLRDVAEEMVAQGNRVTIVCSEGGYSATTENSEYGGERGDVELLHVPSFRFGRKSSFGKLCDYLSFYFLAFWIGLTVSGNPTCFVAMTTPPYLSALVRILSRLRNASHAHWVMDIYPDVLISHGVIGGKTLKARLLRALSCWGFGGERNRKTISLGPDMAEKLKSLHGVDNGVWVPLWSTANEGDQQELVQERSLSLRKERGWNGKTVFLYSGNMGLGHYLVDFLTLAKENEGHSGLCFAFYGGGKRKEEVVRFMKQNPKAPIEVGDYVLEELLGAHLLSADVHLASLEPSWDGCMVPSKIQGIFASGRPVLFMGSNSSSIGQWITRSAAGWVVNPRDMIVLRTAFGEIFDEDLRVEKGMNAAAYYQKHFLRATNCKRVVLELTKRKCDSMRF